MTRQEVTRGFVAAIIIFVLAIAGGALFAEQVKPYLQPSIEGLQKMVEQTNEVAEEARQIVLALTIFIKNSSVALIMLAGGHYLFATPVLFILISNGLLIGLFGTLLSKQGISVWAFTAGLLPHGVFELTALVLAGGYAMAAAARRLTSRRVPPFATRMAYFAKVVIPLLAVAAVIEVYLSPLVMSLFLPPTP